MTRGQFFAPAGFGRGQLQNPLEPGGIPGKFLVGFGLLLLESNDEVQAVIDRPFTGPLG